MCTVACHTQSTRKQDHQWLYHHFVVLIPPKSLYPSDTQTHLQHVVRHALVRQHARQLVAPRLRLVTARAVLAAQREVGLQGKGGRVQCLV